MRLQFNGFILVILAVLVVLISGCSEQISNGNNDYDLYISYRNPEIYERTGGLEVGNILHIELKPVNQHAFESTILNLSYVPDIYSFYLYLPNGSLETFYSKGYFVYMTQQKGNYTIKARTINDTFRIKDISFEVKNSNIENMFLEKNISDFEYLGKFIEFDTESNDTYFKYYVASYYDNLTNSSVQVTILLEDSFSSTRALTSEMVRAIINEDKVDIAEMNQTVYFFPDGVFWHSHDKIIFLAFQKLLVIEYLKLYPSEL